MSGEELASIINRYDQISRELENNALGRLDLALETSYSQLEEQLVRSYPKIQANNSLLPTQRAVLVQEELKELLSFIHPQNRDQYEGEFQRLLTTSSQKGTSLADELLRLKSGNSFIKATATVPIEAVAFASRDSVDRLSRYSEDFRLKATGLINQGLIQGWGVQRVAREMRNQLGSTKSSAERIVRTQTIDATDKATRFTYKQNGVEYVQRIATQDSRVCGICAARAGNVYPIDIAPAVIHPQDRCYNMPWMPEWEQKGQTDNQWIKKHAKDAQAQTQDNLNYGLAPFETAAGLTALLKTIWKPGEGYIDKEVERRSYNLALAGLVALLLLRRNPPDQPQPPPNQENQLLRALIIGAAIAGVSLTAYYLARARYRAGFSESAKIAKQMAEDIAASPTDREQITFVIGGFNNKGGKAGLEQAELYKEFLGNHFILGVENPWYEVEYETSDPRKPLAILAKGLQALIVDGRNADAVKMAAVAYKYHLENPDKPINLLGYSGGGIVVREAHEILQSMGVNPKLIKSVAVAAPYDGFADLAPGEHLTFMNQWDLFANLPTLNGIHLYTEPNDPIESHEFKSYLENPDFKKKLLEFLDRNSENTQNFPFDEFNPYIAARAKYRAGLERFAEEASDLASKYESELQDIEINQKYITLIAAGFSGTKGAADPDFEEAMKTILGESHTVNIDYPEFDVDSAIEENIIDHLSKVGVMMLTRSLVDRKNPAAIRMAAMAAAHYKKYGKPVNLVGYSGGGILVREAIEIMNQMGVPVKGVGIGAPWFGFHEVSPDQYITVMGSGDIVGQVFPTLNRINLKDVIDHTLTSYLESKEIQPTISNFFAGIEQKNQYPNTGLIFAPYYLVRAKYRAGFKDFAKEAAKLADDYGSTIEDVDPEVQQITLVVSGFVGRKGEAHPKFKETMQNLLPQNHIYNLPYPEFDVTIENDTIPLPLHLANTGAMMLTRVLIDGKNPAAIRMAAMAAAYHEDSGKPITLIGYSGGGIIVREAIEILNLMGVPVKGIGIGAPWFGIHDIPPEQYLTFMGAKDPVNKQFESLNRVVFENVTDHGLSDYLNDEEVVNKIYEFFDLNSVGEAEILGGEIIKYQKNERSAKEPKRSQPDFINAEDWQIIEDSAINPDILGGEATKFRRLWDYIQGGIQPKAGLPAATETPAINPEVLGGEATKFNPPKRLESEPIDVYFTRLWDYIQGGIQPKAGLPAATEIPAINPDVLGGETTKFKPPKRLESEPIDVYYARIWDYIQGGIQPKAGLPAADDGVDETLVDLVPQLALLPADQINKFPSALASKILQMLKDNPQAGDDVELPKLIPGFAPLLALPEADLAKAIMRGELIKLQLPEVELEPVTVEARNELEQRIAANLYKQVYSSDRAYARLAEGRIRQRVAEINRQNLPPLPKLQQLRKAIFEEIQNVVSEVKPIKPPGVANEEQMHSFRFGKTTWYASGKLKESSPELDLVRQLAEMELPSEITQHINNIYVSRQKNAAEVYWRKKLKLITGKVPATPNLEDSSITFHSGKTNKEEFFRQAAYIKAYKEWGQLIPPQSSDYYRAMQQEQPTTGYGKKGPAQDFADSVSQFFIDPDHLKKFSPARYEAISKMLNYRHPIKVTVPPADLYKQKSSTERGYARLAEGRIRQRVAEINRDKLPPQPKLQQLRKAIFEEIQNVVSETKSISPPGVAKSEQMHSFRFGNATWYASGELKESSPELDLVRQVAELELPSEITQHVNNIYISKQKNASEAYWRKKLKFASRVPATPNLEDGSITFHSGRANREEFLRQAAYLKAYKEWGQLIPLEGSDYHLAMQQEKPTTGYGTRGAAQDFADSVSQFFVNPDHLKKFSPARYEAISRMLNYSHPPKPVPPIPPLPPPDPRIIKAAQERLASINQKFQAIADIPKLRMDLAGAIGKKVSEQLNKFKVKKLLQDSDRLATESTSNQQKLLEQTNNQNRKLDDLERLVIQAETAYAQLLNPLNTPYFDTAPAKLAQLKRQIDAANREIAAVERAAKNAEVAKDKAQKIQQLMDELTTQKDTLKLSAQTRKLQKKVANLGSELDEAEQALRELPQSEERSQALRDLIKLRAEIANLQSAENPNVQDFQRRTLQPYLDRANQTTQNLEQVAAKARETRDKFASLQQRFSQLPTRPTQLSPEQQQRYKQIQILRRTQGELPTQIATFRDLSNKHQEQLAALDQDRQKTIEDYSIQRPSAVNNIQAKIERTLQMIESNLQELRAFPPGTIAWVLDSKKWETTEMPSDLALALQSAPGETKQEKLKKFVTKIETAYANINAFVESIEKDLDYPNQVAITATQKINSSINKWRLIEIQLENNIKNISARRLKQLMANPEKINIQDVLGYAQQTAADLDAWNRLYVEMALSDDTIDPKAIIDQSEAYRKAREMFGQEVADLQANIVQTIRANLEANKAAKEMIAAETAKPLAYQINGKMMSPEEIKAQLQTIVPELSKYLNIPEIADIKITLPPEEVARQNQIKLEAEKAAQKRLKIQTDPQLLELRGNLRTVVSELTRQRENAATTGYLPPRYRKFLEIRIAKLEKDQGDLQAQIQTRLEALNND